MARKRLAKELRSTVTLQLQDIFKLLEIERTQDAERLAQTLLNFLVYLAPGDKVVTPWCTFEKFAPDLLHIASCSKKIMAENAADVLDIKAIIHLPN